MIRFQDPRMQQGLQMHPGAEVIPIPATFQRQSDPSFSKSAYDRLAATGTPLVLQPGETLYIEGDPACFCYEVVSGMIKESNTLEDGRHHVAGFNPPGSFFGLSHTSLHQHTAESIGETRLRCYTRARFETMVSESPDLSRYIMTQIMRRLDRAESRMMGLGRLTAVERVADFLLDLVEQSGSAPSAEIRIPMSRQDMADHLGLAAETVCRVLKKLRTEGSIRMPLPYCVSIMDPERLRVITEWEDCDQSSAWM